MRKTKIYIFHPYSKVGGADLTISRLINNLDHKKYEIVFICIGNPGIKTYLKKKITFKRLKAQRAFLSMSELRKIINNNYNKDLKFKKVIFLSNQNFANIISILSLRMFKHLKIILIERNNPIELDYIKSYKNKLIRKLIPLTYKYADRVVGISKELSKDLGKICFKKVQTIYNPAFDEKVLSKVKNSKIKKYKVILCVARFEKQKNHIMLLKAFKLSLKNLNSQLILVGYGSEKKKIKEFIKSNNLREKVKIVLSPKNIKKYYQIADLFVLCSIYEGFGNVIVEAGSYKLPIISTNCKSGPKEILSNGKYGDL